jgi:DNA-directed RNA polymerase subunit omega
MIYPSPDKLDRAGSKYALVIVAAKRARQIKDGAPKLVGSTSANPLTVALEELAEGAIVPLQVGGPERLPDMVSQGPVLHGLVASGDMDDLDDSAAFSDQDEDVLHDDVILADDDGDVEIHGVDEDIAGGPDQAAIGIDDESLEEDGEPDLGEDEHLPADDNVVSLEEMADAEQDAETDETEE